MSKHNKSNHNYLINLLILFSYLTSGGAGVTSRARHVGTARRARRGFDGAAGGTVSQR